MYQTVNKFLLDACKYLINHLRLSFNKLYTQWKHLRRLTIWLTHGSWRTTIKTWLNYAHIGGAILCFWSAASKGPFVYYPNGEGPRWNDIDKENRRTRKPVTMPLCPPHPTWTDPGANPVLRCERPTANRLSHVSIIRKWYNGFVLLVVCIWEDFCDVTFHV
jgi:hypothetical protein